MLRFSTSAFVASMIVIGSAAAVACADGETAATNDGVDVDASTPESDSGTRARDDAGAPADPVGCPNAEEPTPGERARVFDPGGGEYINGAREGADSAR